MWIIVFFLFNHSVHKDLSCNSCHNSQLNNKIISSDKKGCEKCHTKRETKFKLKIESNIIFDHEKHQFLDCKSCHLQNEKISNPKMESCISCHEKDKDNCSKCHKYQNNRFDFKIENKKIKPKSHYRVNFNNFHIVKDEKECLSCHKKKDCLDCHTTNKQKIKNFHDNNYISIHKYENNFTSCVSCHKDEKDCKACHQKANIDTTKTRSIKNYTIHPKNWQHGDEANRDIVKCISCHTEKDCLKCHKEEQNPHTRVVNICEQKNQLKKSCEKCHKRIEEQCP